MKHLTTAVLMFGIALSGNSAAQSAPTPHTMHSDEPAVILLNAPAQPPSAATPPPPTTDNNTNSTQNGQSSVELELVSRGIYRCVDGSKAVFVDEDARGKYRQCTQIRAPQYEQVSAGKQGRADASPCSGALVYQGSTYIFTDQEPCPIPEAIFKQRKPIEAIPEYYQPQTDSQ